MPIKSISEVRRCPRLGHIRLGIKAFSEKTRKEYPKEVEYFILDPQTGDQQRNEELKAQFRELYGEKPTAIKIMFPPTDPEIFFQQWYKRYGSATLLKCKGDGEVAVCALPEFAEGLEIIGKDEMGLVKVKCLGPECKYQKEEKSSCNRLGALQVLLPELSGIGVWQINTGSWNSIVNLNSALDWLKGLCGRFYMISVILRRVPQDIAHIGLDGKQTRGKHYIMQIDLENINIAQLQQAALIAPEKSLLPALPAPDETKDELFYPEPENGNNKKETPQDPTLKKVQETFNAKQVKTIQDNYGDLERFGKNKLQAEKIIAKIEECRKELGDERFFYVVGNQGWESIAQITMIGPLTDLANCLLSEVRTKRNSG